jgi:hypothetical protein
LSFTQGRWFDERWGPAQDDDGASPTGVQIWTRFVIQPDESIEKYV